MVGAKSQAEGQAAALIFAAIACASCRPIVVHYEWSADRKHLVRVIERGIDQYVERDGEAEPSYRAIGVESLVLSDDGAHLAYAAESGSGWEVVHDGRRSGTWRGIGEIVLSADGEHVAYAALDDRGWRVVRDKRIGPVMDAIMQGSIAMSPDGRSLAYVAERGQRTFVVHDDRTYGGFSLAGRPIFSRDGKRMAFVAARGRTVRVHVDGEPQAPFEEIVELGFSEDGAHVGWFGLRGERWYPVIDGAIGEGFELASSLRFAPSGRAFHLAKDAGRWHAIFGGVRIATHDEIDHRTVCFTGEVPRYGARDGATWSVGGGPRFDAIETLVCAKDRFAYVGRREGRAIVMEGDRMLGSFERADAPVLARDTIGFIAIEAERAFVEIDGRRTPVTMPVLGTLALSADGRRFALLAASERQGLDLIVDGERVGRFDFEEPAALALKHPRALETDMMRRFVEAELAKAEAAR